jgi:hypothetical protein
MAVQPFTAPIHKSESGNFYRVHDLAYLHGACRKMLGDTPNSLQRRLTPSQKHGGLNTKVACVAGNARNTRNTTT